VADKLDGDKRGVKMLLNALSAMDLLVKKEDIYSNTPLSLAFLSKDSSRYIGHIILHHHNLIESWSRLDVAIRSGRSVRHRVTHTDEEQRENFLMGMFNLAMNLAPVLAPEVDLSGRRHLLDLGGGPGTYAIHFCMNNPRLKATVYDMPTTRPFAEKTIAQFNLQNRIDFKDRQGGFCSGTWGNDPDPRFYFKRQHGRPSFPGSVFPEYALGNAVRTILF
jgi:hypothetical protein